MKNSFPFFTKKKKNILHFPSIKLLEDFDDLFGFFSDYPIVGQVTDKKNDIQITQDLLKKIDQKIKDPFYRAFSTAECLTKILAYRNLEENDEISIPTLYFKKPGLTDYQVTKIFSLWHGLPAFGLKPINGPGFPLIIFRGTDFTLTKKEGWASILSDLDFSGPGYHAFFSSKENLLNWIKKEKEKPQVLGYSLGGILATYCCIYLHDYIQKKAPSFAIHPPGISKKVYRDYKNLKKNQKKIPLYSFIAKNDLVSKFRKIVGKTYKISYETLLPLSAHLSLYLGKDLSIERKN